MDKISCPVNSHNEWDPLEEVIVGTPAGAMFPGWETINEMCVPPGMWQQIVDRMGGRDVPYPEQMVESALMQLEGFVQLLESAGVTVRRVDEVRYDRPFGSPAWNIQSGFCAANPRDPFIVFGNEIIETPMADRSRQYEAWAYRRLFKEYFKAGAKWTAAPKPQLLDELYAGYERPPEGAAPERFVVSEFEPVFDAADFVRCGRDIFCQQSNVTNSFGIEWLKRHLGDGYRFHILQSRDPMAIHIDTSFMPLAPGKVLVNPEYMNVENLPEVLRDWDIIIPPEPPEPADPLSGVSEWAGNNVLMLNEKQAVVEPRQAGLIKTLERHGFEPIPCPFEHYYPFLGSFHCATLDVRRRGELQSYFDS